LRRETHSDVLAIDRDGTRHSVMIADISRGGCQVRTENPFKVGEVLTLKHEVLGSRTAEVRWTHAGRAGLMFLG
jgi:hypothetical protein